MLQVFFFFFIVISLTVLSAGASVSTIMATMPCKFHREEGKMCNVFFFPFAFCPVDFLYQTGSPITSYCVQVESALVVLDFSHGTKCLLILWLFCNRSSGLVPLEIPGA